MTLCMHRMSSKLPWAFSILERSRVRTFDTVSCFLSTGRVHASTGKDFRFPNTLGLHTLSVGYPRTAAWKTRGSVLTVHQRGNASDKQTKESSSGKKSLVEARESPYAHLTVGQKGTADLW